MTSEAYSIFRIRDLIRTNYPFFSIYILWIAFVLLIPERQSLVNAYYCFLLLPYLLSLKVADVSGLAQSWIIRTAAMLLVWLYASILWNGPLEMGVLIKFGKYGLVNFSFLILTTSLLTLDERRNKELFFWLGCVALIVGAVSVVNYHAVPVDRFTIGHWSNVNTGPTILGIIAVGLLAGPLTDCRSARRASVSIAIALLIIGLVIASASRAAMVALLFGLISIATFGSSRRIVLGILIAGVIVAALAVVFGMIDFAWWRSRADGGRVAVWSYYADLALKRPITGFGISNEWNYRSDPDTDAPHNMLISTFFYGGAAAALAFVALTLAGMRAGIVSAQQRAYVLPIALVVYVTVHGIFESVVPFHSASWIWIYLWVPFAYAAAAERRTRLNGARAS